jgi:ketosteroid isomerase-like protein
LHDRLRSEFGKENVFMDFDSIPYGVDFREHIKATLERADVVVAVVGPGWLGGQKEASRRIDDPSDFVRLEIAGALHRGIPVIPVLVDNTPMPKPDALPPDMEAFAFRNALILDTGIDFHHHADRLVAGIRQLLERIAPNPTTSPKESSQTETVNRAEAISLGTKTPAMSAPADVELDVQEGQSSTEVRAPKHAGRPPSEPAMPREFEWNQKHIAMALGGVVLIAAIGFGIVIFERKRSNTDAKVTPALSERTPAASPTPAETAAPTVAPTTAAPAIAATTAAPTVAATTPPLPSPVMTVAPTEAPVVAETPGANSVNSPPSMPTPFPSVDQTEAVRQFIRDYYDAMSRRDLDTVVSMFADRVDYQGQGRHDRRYIRNDTQNYFRRWDRIYFEVRNDIDISQTGDGEFQVRFNFPFVVGQGNATDKRGVSSQVWILRKDSQGKLQIVSQREKVIAAGSETRRRRR